MPAPLWIGKVNKVGLNRLTKRLAPHLPGFGVVVHHGRTSGRIYRTPVNLFPVDGGYVVALTYGLHTDWVKNVVAAGGCQLHTRGSVRDCENPRVYRDTTRAHIRPFERRVLGLLHVDDFLHLDCSRP